MSTNCEVKSWNSLNSKIKKKMNYWIYWHNRKMSRTRSQKAGGFDKGFTIALSMM